MNITMEDFDRVEIRVGTIVGVEDFPSARKPAYRLRVDFGEHGIKASSAQITRLYRKEDLLHRQVIGVVNLPPRQIGSFFSEVLILGFASEDNQVILAQPERPTPNGTRLT